ncbi:MAG: DegV family protein [Chloroflexota bacterium]|nr:DegV family protein [Chloroflexota bacterium]
MQPQSRKQRVAIVTDSAVCLPAPLIQEYDIHIIPYQLIWNGKVYLDGEDMMPSEFFERFGRDGNYPTTAQPLPQSFADTYERVAQQADSILSIHVPETLTTTIQVAHLMAQQAPIPVRVVSAGTAGPAQGFVVLAAARAAKAGADLTQVSAVVKAYSRRVGMYATLQTLEHLRRGGRIGQAAALLGTRLNIQPVVELKEGRVRVTAATRSRERAKQRILDEVERRVGSQSIKASVFHADAPKEAQDLAQKVRQRFRCGELYTVEFTPMMGAHTGPGVLGVAFCPEET